MISKIRAILSPPSGSSVGYFPWYCEAADIKIDRCQHAVSPDTTKDIDNWGWWEDLQIRTNVSDRYQKGKEYERIYHLTVPGASLYDFMDGLELELKYN